MGELAWLLARLIPVLIVFTVVVVILYFAFGGWHTISRWYNSKTGVFEGSIQIRMTKTRLVFWLILLAAVVVVVISLITQK